MGIDEYLQSLKVIDEDFREAVAQFGLPFEAAESAPRSKRAAYAQNLGCHCENAESSLWRGWISPACIACRTGERTRTFFASLACNRACYFCFNPNQQNYEYHRSHRSDIAADLRAAYEHGERYDYLAITGGEPLLFPDELFAFLSCACELYPRAHTRLYTNGDLLDEKMARALGQAGLDEIRISIKPPDVEAETPSSSPYAEDLEGLGQPWLTKSERRSLELAVTHIPAAMVEMPAIPGTLPHMKALLKELDELGVRGVNLLEFCFPLTDAAPFAKRGFTLRRQPYRYLYNYWYAGGLPIAGSEKVCLDLLEFATQEKLDLGIHYCSSDNKNSGQIFQQNKPFREHLEVRAAFSWLEQNDVDYLLECIKTFGEDAQRLRALWNTSASHELWTYDETVPALCLHPSLLDAAREALPNGRFARSKNVLEPTDDGRHLRPREISCVEL